MKPTDQDLKKAAKAIRNHIDSFLYSPFVETGTMRPSIKFHPFRSIASIAPRIVTSPYVTEKRKRARQKQEGFWAKLWRGLSDHNPWSHSLIEYYETEEPAIIFDRRRNTIICHPALEWEIKEAAKFYKSPK